MYSKENNMIRIFYYKDLESHIPSSTLEIQSINSRRNFIKLKRVGGPFGSFGIIRISSCKGVYYRYDISDNRKLNFTFQITENLRKHYSLHVDLSINLKINADGKFYYDIIHDSSSCIPISVSPSLLVRNDREKCGILFKDFPKDVLLEIFAYLDWKELIKLGLISYRWRELIFKSKSWNTAHVNFEIMRDPYKFFNLLKLENVFEKIDSITMPKLKSNSLNKFNLSSRHKHLRTLVIELDSLILDKNRPILVDELIITEGIMEVSDFKNFFRFFPKTKKAQFKISAKLDGYMSDYIEVYLNLNEKNHFGVFSDPNRSVMTPNGTVTTTGFCISNRCFFEKPLLFLLDNRNRGCVIYWGNMVSYEDHIRAGFYLI